MCDFDIDRWIEGFKVRSFPWIDGKRIYFNVQFFRPGQSIEKPPVWDKTVYITMNENGIKVVVDFLSSLTVNISKMNIDNEKEVVLTF